MISYYDVLGGGLSRPPRPTGVKAETTIPFTCIPSVPAATTTSLWPSMNFDLAQAPEVGYPIHTLSMLKAGAPIKIGLPKRFQNVQRPQSPSGPEEPLAPQENAELCPNTFMIGSHEPCAPQNSSDDDTLFENLSMYEAKSGEAVQVQQGSSRKSVGELIQAAEKLTVAVDSLRLCLSDSFFPGERMEKAAQTDDLPAKVLELVRVVEDFPKPGIHFRDIVPLLSHPLLFNQVLNRMAKMVQELEATAIVSPEARGFLFGAPIAQILKIPLIVARKAGKLPPPIISKNYSLEYNANSTLEIPADCLAKPSMNICIVDDVLATGGTVHALAELINQVGRENNTHVTGCVFLINLKDLNTSGDLFMPLRSVITI